MLNKLELPETMCNDVNICLDFIIPRMSIKTEKVGTPKLKIGKQISNNAVST